MPHVTADKLSRLFKNTPKNVVDRYVDALNHTFEHYQINTPKRIAMFLAQVGHESGGLQHIEENLNYRAERLMQVFPKYFRDVNPDDYGRNPQKIANRVYASRMGNGPESSGDGYRYRGRGLIQLTGKSNYENFAKAVNKTLDEAVQYLGTPEGACMSAGWFWNVNGLNAMADAGDVVGSTRRINGGTNGLEDRQNHYREALHIFGA